MVTGDNLSNNNNNNADRVPTLNAHFNNVAKRIHNLLCWVLDELSLNKITSEQNSQ